MTELDNKYKTIEASELDKFKGQVIFLALEVKGPTLKKKERAERIGASYEQATMLHVSKDLINQKELRKVRGAGTRLKNYIRDIAVNGGQVSKDVHMIPLRLAQRAEEAIATANTTQDASLNTLEGKYPDLINEARERLGDLFDASQYPTWESLKASFGITHKWLVLDTPQALAAVSEVLYQQEVERMKEQWTGAFDDVRQGLREKFAEFVERLVEAMKLKEDGKPSMALQERLVDKFKDFCTLFETQNVTNDAEMSELVEKAKALIGGESAKSLRKDDDSRERILKSMESLKENVAQVVKPVGRKIRFNDAQEAA